MSTLHPQSLLSSNRFRPPAGFRPAVALALCLALLGGGCFEGERGAQFYGKVTVPRAQEFRWSDGGLPKIFDPALAAAPPDTDAVRAMFEGLTDYDPRQLKPVSAIATRWESSPDKRQWTFYLRKNARWSNGDAVTAHDFVRSWRRTLHIGERAPHARLLTNIEGARRLLAGIRSDGPGVASTRAGQQAAGTGRGILSAEGAEETFGATAVSDDVLRVRLRRPDENLPELLAHPVFRPVHRLGARIEDAAGEDESNPAAETAAPRLISNGAFRLSSAAPDAVVLERDQNYWDAAAVGLERVRFVASEDAEQALAAYRAGELDAVTNASLEPLALKLLAPYKDFQRTVYGALTYYTFNTARAPFDDVRVRRALSLAVDRERISGDTMGGTAKPAAKFLPTAGDKPEDERNESGRAATTTAGVFDLEQARRLMSEAGYPGGKNFPRIRLLVNRNEQHRRVAQAVAAMWESELGVRTEIISKEWADYESALAAGEYDLARRQMVMQTVGEEANMREMFAAEEKVEAGGDDLAAAPHPSAATTLPESARGGTEGERKPSPPVTSEAQALRELPGMPIYFASSSALVKPYVGGFVPNLLDFYSLKHVRINTGWKPAPAAQTIRIARND